MGRMWPTDRKIPRSALEELSTLHEQTDGDNQPPYWAAMTNSSQESFGKDAQKYINSQVYNSSDRDRRLTAIGQLHPWDVQCPITVINSGLSKLSLSLTLAVMFPLWWNSQQIYLICSHIFPPGCLGCLLVTLSVVGASSNNLHAEWRERVRAFVCAGGFCVALPSSISWLPFSDGRRSSISTRRPDWCRTELRWKARIVVLDRRHAYYDTFTRQKKGEIAMLMSWYALMVSSVKVWNDFLFTYQSEIFFYRSCLDAGVILWMSKIVSCLDYTSSPDSDDPELLYRGSEQPCSCSWRLWALLKGHVSAVPPTSPPTCVSLPVQGIVPATRWTNVSFIYWTKHLGWKNFLSITLSHTTTAYSNCFSLSIYYDVVLSQNKNSGVRAHLKTT